MVAGALIRIWGSGNLRKGLEVTTTGAYAVVRHPLYSGSLAFFLAYFLTASDPVVGIALFSALVVFVYYPTMLDEEDGLSHEFPEQFSAAASAPLPRLIPNPFRLARALRSDRFVLRSARSNLGLRSLSFLILLPLFLKLLARLHDLL